MSMVQLFQCAADAYMHIYNMYETGDFAPVDCIFVGKNRE